jgi:hypothetical protein
MCSVLLLRHYEARKPEGRGRAAKLRFAELVALLALPALVFLAGGAMAKASHSAASLSFP